MKILIRRNVCDTPIKVSAQPLRFHKPAWLRKIKLAVRHHREAGVWPWKVYEVTTGLSVCGDNTRALVTKRAKQTLIGHGRECCYATITSQQLPDTRNPK